MELDERPAACWAVGLTVYLCDDFTENRMCIFYRYRLNRVGYKGLYSLNQQQRYQMKRHSTEQKDSWSWSWSCHSSLSQQWRQSWVSTVTQPRTRTHNRTSWAGPAQHHNTTTPSTASRRLPAPADPLERVRAPLMESGVSPWETGWDKVMQHMKGSYQRAGVYLCFLGTECSTSIRFPWSSTLPGGRRRHL